MTPITCWYAYSEKTRGYHFNHYEVGHVESKRPTPKSELQKVWLEMKWLKALRYMNERMEVVE
jgi:hypothetical protein